MEAIAEKTLVVAWRLVRSIPILVGIMLLNFFLVHLAPGDPITVLAGEAGGAPPEYIDQLREQYGLDQPLIVQLGLYLKSMVMLDFGYSFRHSMPVGELILQKAGPTLLLMGTAFILSIVMGGTLGIIAAVNVNTWIDRVISVVTVFAYATPLFWLGLMLLLVFSIKLDLLPSSGMENVVAFHEGWRRIGDIAVHLILPAFTLSVFYMAIYARMMRASMLDQRGMEYVTTARAKGLRERSIVFRHIVRNALLPVLTMAGLQAGAMVGGSVVIESVFAWPGIGQLAYQSLFARDYNLLLGIFFLSACVVILVNTIVDILYSVVDPRVSL